ncbi:MFS transporter [uncultured Devosia sp.]|uniref:MFS transporter n=1 Tax=uncultured Devosia sp. TaxID=211434 RepID=UPI002630B9C0|nr:MFS transporter [uncultured Devosia sp.]
MNPRNPGETASRPTLIILMLAAVVGLASLATSIANITLPALSEDFSAPFAQVQGVIAAYLAALTLSVLLAGRLGDRFGMKPMLMLGVSLFAVASLASSLAPNLSLLVAARVVQGIGAALMMTLTLALMRQNAGETHLGRAMGLLGTVSAVGTALGPSLGGVLLPVWGWRGPFGILVPLALLALVLAWVALPRDGSTRNVSTPKGRTELNRRLMVTLVSNVLVAAVMMTTLVVGPFYLGSGLGLDARAVGLVMTLGPAISIASGIPSGRLVDALGSASVIVIGAVLLAAGTFLLALLPDMAGATNYMIGIFVLTPGYQLFQAANNTSAMGDVPNERRGTVSGWLNLSRNTGLIAGAVVMGAIFALATGTSALAQAEPGAIASGMRLTFSLAGLMMLMVVAMSIGRRGSRGGEL